LRAIENRADSLQNPPARVQFQPTAVGLALRCARIAFAVAYPEFTLIKERESSPKLAVGRDYIMSEALSRFVGLNA
jgi:hypothetical protein